MRHFCRLAVVFLILPCLVAPAFAEDLGYRGWGPRVGFADDPDQVIAGAHFDFGEFTDHVRFVPNVELGVGDDHTILALTAPAHYVWENLSNTMTEPYAGGGVTVGFIDRDHDGRGRDDDSDVELALKAIGGAAWRLEGGSSFFVELNLVMGDIHDVQALAGWMFHK